MDGKAADDVLLRAHNLGKSYTQYASRLALMADRLTGSTRRGQEHWALRGATFELRRGECVGVVGRNGAGKSTLLALLGGILQPTEGRVEAKGKVLSLLELGAGMDPDATGRQNARIHLMVHGVGTGQVERRLEDVAAFADIGAAFDEPVRTYSAGMFLRVAFAANAVLEPDVLVVDEAIAVGDLFFQQKCHRRMRELRERGVAIVLATHTLEWVQQECTRALLVEGGRIVADGARFLVVDRYAGTFAPAAPGLPAPEDANPGAALEGVRLMDAAGRPAKCFVQGETLRVEVDYACSRALANACPGLEVHDATGRRVHARLGLHDEGGLAARLPAGARLRATHTVRLDLSPGEYSLDVGLLDVPDGVVAARASIEPGEVWPQLAPAVIRRGVAAFEVVLPRNRFPYREAAIGPAVLAGAVAVRVEPAAASAAQAQ